MVAGYEDVPIARILDTCGWQASPTAAALLSCDAWTLLSVNDQNVLQPEPEAVYDDPRRTSAEVDPLNRALDRLSSSRVDGGDVSSQQTEGMGPRLKPEELLDVVVEFDGFLDRLKLGELADELALVHGFEWVLVLQLRHQKIEEGCGVQP